MKNDPRQMRMFGERAPKTAGTTVSLAIDYTDKPLGWLAGNRKVVIACDECGKHAIAAHTERGNVWIHTEEIVADANGRTRRKTVSKCSKKPY